MTELTSPECVSRRKQATQAKAGIAFRRGGGAYLGLRHEASAAKPTLHAWEVAKVPWTWTEEDSTQCLQGAGCSDIAILRRGGGRKKWVVKCIFPDADVGAITEILAGETCLVLTRAQSRAHVGISTPLKAHAAAELRAPTTRPGGSVKQDGVAAVPAAGTPKLAKSPGRSRSRGKKDKPSNALCEEIDCGAEGACGFLCLAAALGLQNSESWDKIKGELAVRSCTLRSEIFTWIGRHGKDVEPLWEQDGKATEETEGGAIPDTFDKWHQSILRPRKWIDALCLFAAARRLRLRIIVVVMGTKDEVKNGRGAVTAFGSLSGTPVYLALPSQHYTLLRLDNTDDVPREWANTKEDLGTLHQLLEDMRGGGKSWLPSASSAASQGDNGGATSSKAAPQAGSKRARSQTRGWLHPASESSWMPAASSAAAPNLSGAQARTQATATGRSAHTDKQSSARCKASAKRQATTGQSSTLGTDGIPWGVIFASTVLELLVLRSLLSGAILT